MVSGPTDDTRSGFSPRDNSRRSDEAMPREDRTIGLVLQMSGSVPTADIRSVDPEERRRAAISMAYSEPGTYRDDAALSEIIRRGSADRAFLPAISALGSSGSAQATESLVGLLKEVNRLNQVEVDFLFTALSRYTAHADRAIPSLRAFLDDCNEEHRQAATKALKILCKSVLESHYRGEQPPRGSYVDIYGRGGWEAKELWEVERQGLPKRESGLLVDNRFRFINTSGLRSECQYRIYRGESKNPIVVLTTDEHSYGAGVTNNIEPLANAIAHIHGLDTKRTTWISHFATGCGSTGHEKLELVSFDRSFFGGALSNPTWRSIDRGVVATIFDSNGLAASM